MARPTSAQRLLGQIRPPKIVVGPNRAPVAPRAPTFPNLMNDPGVLAAENAQQRGLADLSSQLTGNQNQALIDFGDPSIATDPQTAALARANFAAGHATLAKLLQAHQMATNKFQGNLAGRGLLDSGELGYDTKLENTSYGNQQYDAHAKLLGYLNGLVSNYLGQRNTLQNAVDTAMNNAYKLYVSNPAYFMGAAK